MYICMYLSNTTTLTGYESILVAQLCPTWQPHGLKPARLLCPWDSPGKNTGVGCYFLLWGIFSTKGLNQGTSLVPQLVKNLPAMKETPVQFLGRGGLLEKE